MFVSKCYQPFEMLILKILTILLCELLVNCILGHAQRFIVYFHLCRICMFKIQVTRMYTSVSHTRRLGTIASVLRFFFFFFGYSRSCMPARYSLKGCYEQVVVSKTDREHMLFEKVHGGNLMRGDVYTLGS